MGITLPFLQTRINPFWIKNYSPKQVGLVEGLSPDHFILALAGLREFLSSVLWLKGDTFFHEGNYDAMLPILRIATILDPHNIEIYATGMWHMAYNFTDTDNRSDRRYLPSALAFGKEGALHNPHSYELFFNLGMLWMQKIEDRPEKAVEWFKKACSKSDILLTNKSMLAHAFIKNNEVKNALTTFENLIKEVECNPEDLDYKETIENNLDNLLIRSSERGLFTPQAKDISTLPLIDPQLKVQVKIVASKKIEIQGMIQLPFQGVRLKLILKDKNFPYSKPCGADWEHMQLFSVEGMPGKTFLQDQMYVKDKHFKTVIDLDKDPGIYPLNTKEYLLEIFYDPRYAPAPIQNRIGINGEGFKNCNSIHSDCLPRRKIVYAQYKLELDQILRKNKWENKIPVFLIPSPKQ